MCVEQHGIQYTISMVHQADLDSFLDGVDGTRQKTAHLVIIVDVVRVTDAHEQHVGRQARQLLYGYTWLQFYMHTNIIMASGEFRDLTRN